MKPESLGHLAVKIGQRYVAVGGPTSRLEDRLDQVGSSYGYSLEAWGTGTGVTVCLQTGEGEKTTIHMGRTQQGAVNLEEVLKLERFMDELRERKMDYAEALTMLEEISSRKRSPWFSRGALFTIGLASSWPFFHQLIPAILSGVIVLLVSSIAGPMAEKWRFSRIFCDFLATLIAMFIGVLLSPVVDAPIESIVIGTFILLVPGSLLTNAVSELAEQHFLSGTVKLMKALLVLLAMGTAFLLAKDFAPLFGHKEWVQSLHQPPQNFWFLFAGVFAILTSFAFIIHVPLRMIPLAVIAGGIGWFTLQALQGHSFVILDTFLPAFVIGIISLLFGKLFGSPSQLFSIPGLISMAPGILAFSVFMGHTEQFETPASLRVTIVAGGLAFGLLSARIPAILYRAVDQGREKIRAKSLFK